MKFLKNKFLISLLALCSTTLSQTALHTYRLIILDEAKKPLDGATIAYEFMDQAITIKKATHITDSSGQFGLSLPVNIKTSAEWGNKAFSNLLYHIERPGYYPEEGVARSFYGSSFQKDIDPVVADTIILEPLMVYHKYVLSITDFDGKPLKSAVVKLTSLSGGESLDTSITTTHSGKASVSIQVDADDTSYHNSREYASSIKYEISHDRYYQATGEISSDFGSRSSACTNPKVENVRLFQPSDYLSRNFAQSKEGIATRKSILQFIDLIRLQSLLSDTYLEYRSIDLITFKTRKYFRMKLVSTNVYNSLKLNNYEIGKKLFDEVIRKVLSPLNSFISNPNMFFGYDITIVSSNKDFGQEYAVPRSLEYRFLMPESAVRSYKNKDISGQQLVNKSIILLDDERIDLTLQ